MHYIVLDLEFNQGFDIKNNETTNNPQCPFEIIQIGAVKLDEALNTIGSFNEFVKPQIYSKLHPYVAEITGISMNHLSKALYFDEALDKFKLFLGNSENILCVWGLVDITELFRNIRFYSLEHNDISKKYINLQQHASRYFGCPKGINIGLSNAVSLLELEESYKFHDALGDAYYTSEIFKNIYSKSIKPTHYSIPKKRIK